MRRFKIHFPGESTLQRGRPTRHADAPLVARFQTWEAVLGPRCDQIVSIEHGEVEEVLIHEHANRVQPDILRPGAAITISVKSGHRITAAAAQFCSENVRWHHVK